METSKTHFKFVIIGAGNVATHFAKRLQKKGNEVLQIVSKSEANAKQLSLQLNVPFTTDIKKINKLADVYLFCVPDDEIEKLATVLRLPSKLILHTSGSVHIDVLKKTSSNVGVLYPLQSFSKQVKVSFSKVPLLIEASNAATLSKLKTVAASLSKQVTVINSSNRLKVHVAATFVNNFTNHLYTLSCDFLDTEKLALFNLLQPLMKQTLKKVKKQKPSLVQTGPAKRGDKATIKKHIEILKKYPQQKQVYELFTQLITNYYER